MNVVFATSGAPQQRTLVGIEKWLLTLNVVHCKVALETSQNAMRWMIRHDMLTTFPNEMKAYRGQADTTLCVVLAALKRSGVQLAAFPNKKTN